MTEPEYTGRLRDIFERSEDHAARVEAVFLMGKLIGMWPDEPVKLTAPEVAALWAEFAEHKKGASNNED